MSDVLCALAHIYTRRTEIFPFATSYFTDEENFPCKVVMPFQMKKSTTHNLSFPQIDAKNENVRERERATQKKQLDHRHYLLCENTVPSHSIRAMIFFFSQTHFCQRNWDVL